MMTGTDYGCCRYRAWFSALVLALICGCSAAPRSDPPSYGDWRPASGEPVDRIGFSNLLDWHPLNRDWLVLRFNGGRSFALRPRDPCIGDVREARTLQLVAAMPNLLHRSDQIRLDDNVCLIEEIRSVSSPPEQDALRGGIYRSGDR